MKINNEFKIYGQKCVRENLVISFFGNMSVKSGDMLYITATKTLLDMLEDGDIIQCDINNTKAVDKIASSELPSHKMIYENSKHKSIIHAHCTYSVIYSSGKQKVDLYETEFLPFMKNIPVVSGASGSWELAGKLGSAASLSELIVVENHGVFSCGSSLNDSYIKLAALESISRKEVLRKKYKG